MALSFIKSSGNIITEDFCLALASETKADYVKDKSFGADMKKVDEVIASAFDKLRERWEDNRTDILDNKLDTTELRNKWIIPLLKLLGYQPVFSASNIKSKSEVDYHISYKGWESEYAPLIHMVHSSQDFDSKDKSSRTHSNKSPHDALQQYLNTSHHQWAILINGKKVRLLRDFYHSISKGFLEFDLESIFETASSEQFRVLYRILHRSRIENEYQGERVIEYDDDGESIETEDNCLLEKFHKKSIETGVSVGKELRNQVIAAIEGFGNGFAQSLNPDEFQNGKVKAFYGEILNIIYRLLFLSFAEQKGWLPVRNSIYARTYSLNALRELAVKGNYSHDEEHDLWEGLKITFKLVANGYEFKNEDKINAFGGQLFSDKKIAVINNLSLKNKFLLDAIYRLSYFELNKMPNRINYANLAIDELGSVYESLLDYEPKLAPASVTVGKREIRRGQFYLDDRGTDRKTTGSYYTDSRLVAQLIESALVPVIENALRGKTSKEEKVKAILDLKVADIACGSGAFICAALEKMGEQLALIQMGDEERPTEDQLREAKRDVLLHCIYGVDLNPMALELAKFSLWITASLPDMPLTFLDHKLKCGNSLIGATPQLIEKGIPAEAYKPVGNDNAAICTKLKASAKKHIEKLSKVSEPAAQYGLSFSRNETDELLRLREVLNNRKQENTDDVDLAEEEYHRLEKLERKFKEWLMADVWTAAFFIEKTEIDLEFYPTNVTLENLRENQPVNSLLIENVLRISDQYKFFHFHLEFPEVFEKGGFDCLLGNPPWERVKLQEKEFFSTRDLSIAFATSKPIREKLIRQISISNPELYLEFLNAKDSAEKVVNFLSKSNRFPLLGKGDINTYMVFTENYQTNISKYGRMGIIVPTGIATDNTTKEFFQEIVKSRKLVSLYDFENSKGLFSEVHRSFKFCLLTISGSKHSSLFDLMFFAYTPEDLNDANRHFSLTDEELFLLNPNTGNCPIFRTKQDAKLTLKIQKNNPVLHNEVTNEYVYEIFFTEMFHMTNDAHLFKNSFEPDSLPLYEGKMIDFFDHRNSSIIINENNAQRSAVASKVTSSEKTDFNFTPNFRYWIDINEYEERKPSWYENEWFFVFQKVTSPTNKRTLITCIIPKSGAGASIPSIFCKAENRIKVLLYANLTSFVLDYAARQKIGGINVAFFFIKQLPVVSLHKYSEKVIEKINEIILKLTYTAFDLKPFAEDLGFYSDPFVWNDKERFQLQCELDAIYAHLYGLEKEDMEYILETFPIVKRKDIAKYGSYRTKDTILALYDEFAWVNEVKSLKAP